MVNLVFITGNERAAGDLTMMDDRFDGLTKKTAGGLLTELAKAGHLAEDELETCRTALRVRNELMHGFFFRHAANLMAPMGMQEIVDELDHAGGQLHAAYELLMTLVFKLEGDHRRDAGEGEDLYGRAGRGDVRPGDTDDNRSGTDPSPTTSDADVDGSAIRAKMPQTMPLKITSTPRIR